MSTKKAQPVNASFNRIRHFKTHRIAPNHEITRELMENQAAHNHDPSKALLWAEKLLESAAEKSDPTIKEQLQKESMLCMGTALKHWENDAKPGKLFATALLILQKLLPDPSIIGTIIQQARQALPHDQGFVKEERKWIDRSINGKPNNTFKEREKIKSELLEQTNITPENPITEKLQNYYSDFPEVTLLWGRKLINKGFLGTGKNLVITAIENAHHDQKPEVIYTKALYAANKLQDLSEIWALSKYILKEATDHSPNDQVFKQKLLDLNEQEQAQQDMTQAFNIFCKKYERIIDDQSTKDDFELEPSTQQNMESPLPDWEHPTSHSNNQDYIDIDWHGPQM